MVARPLNLLRWFTSASVAVVLLLGLAAVAAGRVIVDEALLSMEEDEADSLAEDVVGLMQSHGIPPVRRLEGPVPAPVDAELRRELTNFSAVGFGLFDVQGRPLWDLTLDGTAPPLWDEGLAAAAAGKVRLRWERRDGGSSLIETYAPVRDASSATIAVARVRREFAPVLASARRALALLGGLALAFGGAVFASLWLLVRKADRILAEQRAAIDDLNRRKDLFYAICTHDLRSPLLGIHAGCRILLDRARARAELDETVLHENRRGAERALRLVDDLLDLARVESGTDRASLEEVELRGFLEEIVASQCALARTHGIALAVAVAPNAPAFVDADRHKLRRMLENLVGNALRHAPGSPVTLRLERGVSDDEVRITVADEGPGIEPAERDVIFDRFRRGTGNGPAPTAGTGLGLAIVRDFAALHRGKVEVASEPGRGAAFTVVLPRARGRLAGRGRPDRTPPAAEGRPPGPRP